MLDRLLNEFLIQSIVDNRQVILIAILVLSKELLEYWLGKTDKVKAGSLAELIILTIKKISSKVKSICKKF